MSAAGHGHVMLLLAGAAILALGGVFLLLREAGTQDLEKRVDSVTKGPAAAPAGARAGSAFATLLAWLGGVLARKTRLFSDKEQAAFAQTLSYAGLEPRRHLPLLIGAKVVLTFAAPLGAYGLSIALHLSSQIRLLVVLLGLVVGMRGAQFVLGLMARPYVKALRRGVPDALDLLVISVESGLGLEAALDRVAREMRRSNRPTAMQLETLAEELRVLPDRTKAFANLRARAGDDGLGRLGVILSQTLQYGTPLAQALRAVAAEMRRQRVTMLEQRASRLPVLLVFPLVLFVMPCVVIVMIGPSMLSLFSALGHLGGGISIK